MPHRTTYFFPRQFPDRRFDSSSSNKQDHEKNPTIENERKQLITTTVPATTSNINNLGNNNPSVVESDHLFYGIDEKAQAKKQFAAFCDWLADRKQRNRSSSRDNNYHVIPTNSHAITDHEIEDDLQPLLAPEPASTTVTTAVVDDRSADRNFDRQVSLPRFSSGSSYAGSLFSGTTLDGNFSAEVNKETAVTRLSTTTTATTTRHEIEEEEERVEVPVIVEGSKERLAEKTMESYYLQLGLARRLSVQANLSDDLVLLQATGPIDTWDAEIVSHRLWVSGSLSYNDKISDGFYNILGMNPYLWVMCNDLEEGRRLPSLMSLREIEPAETSMEVILVDRRGDSRLKELEDKAQELYCASENTLVLVEKLGKLVAIYMGGTFPVEQGDLHKRWKVVSRRLRDFQKCIVLPMGSLSMGLCRHRAILFKKLADYIGLPCRIARGCKYCTSDHRSSCLVKIEDDNRLSREYVVDLVGEPGNIHGPDSSISGGFLSPMPSPFQISHLKEYQQPHTEKAPYNQTGFVAQNSMNT
ncbi:serine/threonine-protein kinase CTR1-like, partial [Rutidosis leptorrhynchoides]|uniref:serine/threonine-protein kinase CTR1-like n=1 Tax=Rutidosis leptorrhynchoides TaxID=125765 RepID=UPI003A9A3629